MSVIQVCFPSTFWTMFGMDGSYQTAQSTYAGDTGACIVGRAMLTDPTFYEVYRTILIFDTRALPVGRKILSATLLLYGELGADLATKVQVRDFGHADVPSVGQTEFAAALAAPLDGESDVLTNIDTGPWIPVPLSNPGFIHAGGLTAYSITSSTDKAPPETAPTGDETVYLDTNVPEAPPHYVLDGKSSGGDVEAYTTGTHGTYYPVLLITYAQGMDDPATPPFSPSIVPGSAP